MIIKLFYKDYFMLYSCGKIFIYCKSNKIYYLYFKCN